MKTEAGSNFMIAFNAWYYSFSPYVAAYLDTHWVERAIMKGALYPLVGILYITSEVFSATSSYPEIAALLSGLLASSLIGAFYLGLPLGLIRAKIRRLAHSRLQRSLVRALSAAFFIEGAMLVLGELLSSVPLLILSTSAIVLDVLFMSAAVTSAALAKRLSGIWN
jgi:hypothetical protein